MKKMEEMGGMGYKRGVQDVHSAVRTPSHMSVSTLTTGFACLEFSGLQNGDKESADSSSLH